MDELEISGKRYISSRRAAKEYRYHPDYIGQLVRSKKVLGEKVGRTWYVESTSLATYLAGEKSSPINTERAALVVEERKVKTEKPTEESADEIKIYHIPIHTPPATENSKPKGLVYISDESPLLPEIQKKVRISNVSVLPEEKASRHSSTRENREVKGNFFSVRHALGLVLIGGLSLILAAGASIVLVSTATVGSEQAAGIEFSLP